VIVILNNNIMIMYWY